MGTCHPCLNALNGDWPEQVRDRTAEGTVIPADIPSCMVRTHGATLEKAQARLGLPPGES